MDTNPELYGPTLSYNFQMPPEPLSLKLALVSAAIRGFRHGFDYDRGTAITGITSTQPTRAADHARVVFALTASQDFGGLNDGA